MRPLLPLVLAGVLAGCTQFPQLDQATSAEAKAAGFPRLVPIEQLLKGSTDGRITPELNTALLGQIAALRARADALLAREVIEPEVRAAMQAALEKKPKPEPEPEDKN